MHKQVIIDFLLFIVICLILHLEDLKYRLIANLKYVNYGYVIQL